MKVIFAKHLDSNKEFLFRCEGIYAQKGSCMIVNTYGGRHLVIATSDVEECSPVIAERLGAYLPLKNVLIVIDARILTLAKHAEAKGLVSDFSELPF